VSTHNKFSMKLMKLLLPVVLATLALARSDLVSRFIETLETELSSKISCHGWAQYEKHCYWRQARGKQYDAAEEECESHGAYLAVPNSESENKFITSLLQNKPYTWIGFDYDTKKLSVGNAMWGVRTYNNGFWEDGSHASMSSNWRKLYHVDDAGDRVNGEPVVFIRANGLWSFDAKRQSYPFICERKMGIKVQDSGPSNFKYLFNGCCRGKAGNPKRIGDMSHTRCEALCQNDSDCIAIESNGWLKRSQHGGCYHFYYSYRAGPITNGKCVTNGDQKCFEKPGNWAEGLNV